MKRKPRMGMLGGGDGALIGAIHRYAALMDNHIELVCGCFSSNAQKSIESGRKLLLEEGRIYTSYSEMIEKEASLPEDIRMDFLSIVTPNHVHFAPAKMAMEYGFDVVLDKPMTYSLEQAKELKRIVEATGKSLALTHTYSGYPAIKEAKERISRGELGKIRKIFTEYPQGWLTDRVELDPTSNAGWRTDPNRSGKAGSMGDIGTHALHLAEYVSGAKCTELCAEVRTFVEGRLLDDDGAALLRFDNGATGTLIASQVCAGEENALKLRIYGENGGMEWNQLDPNTLILKWKDRPLELVRTGNGYMSDLAKANTRTPGGHPEGYIEAFANIYRNFAKTVMAKKRGEEPKREWLDFPGVDDGVRGLQFIETIIKAGSDDSQKWVKWIE